MPNLTFLNPLFLWGLAALAVPVLIHIFIQRQKRLVRFSTLRFLKLTHRRPERKRIDNWLLLLLRTLFFLLLILAFARPAMRTTPLGTENPRIAVFVLDRSLSLQTVENGVSRWETLRAKVLAEISKQDASTPIALVSCTSSTEVLLPLGPREQALTAMNALQPTYEESDLGSGLQEALRIAGRRPTDTHASIYLVSDLQRSSAETVYLASVPDDIRVEVISTGSVFVPNAAIRDLHLTGNGKVEAVIANYSDAPAANIKVTFFADGKSIETKPTNLPAFGTVSLEFHAPELATGFHQLRCEIDTADLLPLDNARSLAALTSDPIPVLLVEPQIKEPLSRQQGYFTASALDPGAIPSLLSAARYRVERIAPEGLPGRLSGSQTAPKLIVLPSLRPMTAGVGKLLCSYVQAGGNLMLFVDGDVVPQDYNAHLQQILPALLGSAEDPVDRPAKSWGLGRIDRDELFAIFRTARSGDLTIPHFNHRFAMTALSSARLAASFDDGMPAILVRQAGAGRVALFNTTIGSAWTDWAKHRTYVPALHSIASYLIDAPGLHARCAAETMPATVNATLALGDWAAGQTFTLERPDQGKQQLQADNDGSLRNLDLRQPGFYSLTDAKNAPVRRISAVTPISKQDLSAFTAADFAATQIHRVPAAERGSFDFSRLQNELWKLLLLLGLALATIELHTANRSKQ